MSTLTLTFKDDDQRDTFIAGLLDSWGENSVDAKPTDGESWENGLTITWVDGEEENEEIDD